MNITIADIWSVYNAGDRAILEGLLDGLRRMYPEASFTLVAHFPEGCEDIAGVKVVQDVLAFDQATYQAQLASLDGCDVRLDAVKAAFRDCDLVVSTGGYFLNATPGNAFEYVFLSRLLHFNWAQEVGVPVAVLGQSLGPIEGGALRLAARSTLLRVPVICARDVSSLAFMHRSGVAPHATLTADLAVDLVPVPAAEIDEVMRAHGWPRGAVGISVRNYPGTPKEAFRDMARVADRIVREFKLPILLIGTTVPPSDKPAVQQRERQLGNDDSIALREVYDRMEEKASAAVCVESLPPRLLKGVLGTCRAFISTRMHAAILASTAGVPVGGIAYEFKVTGWFERLGLPELVIPLSEMDERHLWPMACRLLTNTAKIEAHLARVIPEIQAQSRRNFELLAGLLPASGELPRQALTAPRGVQDWAILTAPPTVENKVRQTSAGSLAAPKIMPISAPSAAGLSAEDPRRAWEKESSHYDVLHRRLRKIVELAEGAGGNRLLDIGCSAGTVGAALSGGWTYHGCDVSESAVRSARRGWLIPTDLERGIPEFDGQPYDVVVCSGIFEYLEDPVKVLREIRTRLRPDGRLIVSYFNMRHVSRQPGQAYRHPLWRNDYTPSEFRSLLHTAGWDIELSTWSTAGLGTAPDVRDEDRAAREEPKDAAARADQIAHTLIYLARPQVPVAVTEMPRLSASVVIPAFNRADLLQPVLEAFAGHQAKQSFEVVVVDDGSEVPVKLNGLGGNFRLFRQENRGRAAAVNAGIDRARGEVVIVCDSDIVPTKGFVDEHLAYHREHTAEGATHLGNLEWGMAQPGILSEILGARANPGLEGYTGPINWTQWFTDNWSFKRAFIDRHALRYDTAFKKWGWEELELAYRLERLGATNYASGRATGLHLKPVTLEGLLRSFSTSVPNLLYLAGKIGTDPVVSGWLELRIKSPALLATCEQILRLALANLEIAWPRVQMPPVLRSKARDGAMNAIFALGVERGFADLPPQAYAAVKMPELNESELVLRYADFVAIVFVAQKLAGDDTRELGAAVARLLAPFQGGELVRAFEARIRYQIAAFAKMVGVGTPAREPVAV